MVWVLKVMFWAIRSPKMVFAGDEVGAADVVVEGIGVDGKVVTGVTDVVTGGEVGKGLREVVIGCEVGGGVADGVRDDEDVGGITVDEGVGPPEHAVNTVINIITAARVNIRMQAKIFI
jgi:hypothetical protein